MPRILRLGFCFSEAEIAIIGQRVSDKTDNNYVPISNRFQTKTSVLLLAPWCLINAVFSMVRLSSLLRLLQPDSVKKPAAILGAK